MHTTAVRRSATLVEALVLSAVAHHIAHLPIRKVAQLVFRVHHASLRISLSRLRAKVAREGVTVASLPSLGPLTRESDASSGESEPDVVPMRQSQAELGSQHSESGQPDERDCSDYAMDGAGWSVGAK